MVGAKSTWMLWRMVSRGLAAWAWFLWSDRGGCERFDFFEDDRLSGDFVGLEIST